MLEKYIKIIKQRPKVSDLVISLFSFSFFLVTLVVDSFSSWWGRFHDNKSIFLMSILMFVVTILYMGKFLLNYTINRNKIKKKYIILITIFGWVIINIIYLVFVFIPLNEFIALLITVCCFLFFIHFSDIFNKANEE